LVREKETKCSERLRIGGDSYVLYKKTQRKPEAQEIARWLRVMRRWHVRIKKGKGCWCIYKKASDR